MFQYTRLENIFKSIEPNEFVKPSTLADSFHITERTLRSDINNINETLTNYDIKIKLKRNEGYYLIIDDNSKYEELLHKVNNDNSINSELETSEDRIKYILNILLNNNDFIGYDDLADIVYISKNTLQNYLKRIKTSIDEYDLEYIIKPGTGIKIIGNENNKRNCIMNEILLADNNLSIDFSKDERLIFKDIDLDELKQIVLHNMQSIIMHTSDMNLKNLVIHLALMITRITNDNYITDVINVEMPEDIKDKIEAVCNEIEDLYGIIISKGEKRYLYLHLIANTDFNQTDISDMKIKNLVKSFLETIYMDYNFDLRNDEILNKDLFLHFKSILSNKTYALNKRNPLLNTIKTNFPLAFEITLTSTTKVFTNEKYKLNEDEVGYVSLHVGAAIERCFSGSINKKSVILVCGSGQATTRMLEARLNVFFNDKISIVRNASYKEFCSYTSRELKNIDFVISTIPLKNDLIPTITVDFALKNKDIEKISKFLTSINSSAFEKSSRFFSPDCFIYYNDSVDKETILKDLYNRLKDNDICDATYYQSVLKRESVAKTNMNKVFALPHSMDLCAKSTHVAVAITHHPTLWNDEKETVQIVFMLAIKQGEQVDIEHLYDLFIEIVNNPKLQQELVHSHDFNTFLNSINNHI